MHKKYILGLFFILLIRISYSMPSQQSTNTTEEDDENAWRNWDDGDNDYEDYYDDKLNFTTTTADSISDSNNNIIDVITNNFNNLKENLKNVFREPKSIEPICPKYCHCTHDYEFINCSNYNLKTIPTDIPMTALKIDLSNNEISEITENDFSTASNVKEIILFKNQISKISSEAFKNLTKLEVLNLSANNLTEIDPDVFIYAIELINLDLSKNQLLLPENISLLNLPNLTELNLRETGIKELYPEIFANLTGLNALKIDNNDFDKKINTKAFEPLKNLVKLYLPELSQDNTEKLCQLLKKIDNVSFKNFDVSCYEFVLGQTFNESIILKTDSPPIKETLIPTKKIHKDNGRRKKMNQTEEILDELAGNATRASIISDSSSEGNEENENKVAISSQTINHILIGIIVIACIGLLIGVICRKDYFGIKTKLCRSKKSNNRRPSTTDQVRPTEEYPLNKIQS